jgi:hypothetical protein
MPTDNNYRSLGPLYKETYEQNPYLKLKSKYEEQILKHRQEVEQDPQLKSRWHRLAHYLNVAKHE